MFFKVSNSHRFKIRIGEDVMWLVHVAHFLRRCFDVDVDCKTSKVRLVMLSPNIKSCRECSALLDFTIWCLSCCLAHSPQTHQTRNLFKQRVNTKNTQQLDHPVHISLWAGHCTNVICLTFYGMAFGTPHGDSSLCTFSGWLLVGWRGDLDLDDVCVRICGAMM